MSQISSRRLSVLKGHLQNQRIKGARLNTGSRIQGKPCNATKEEGLEWLHPRTEGYKSSFSVDEMAKIFHGEITEDMRLKVFSFLKRPIMRKRYYNLTKENARSLTTAQTKVILEFKKQNPPSQPKEDMLVTQLMGYYNASVLIKTGVQLVLFGGSIKNLGTQRHQHLLEKIETLEIPGSFGMTELMHGSNVQDLETTAVYDPTTREFVVNTPHAGATKWWLGNAQRDAHYCTVFARLLTKGKDYGVHAFLVPVRDPKTMIPYPGVHIGDCGDKVGLHGVDNGFMHFSNVRIPLENLLNKFSEVLPDGTFVSKYVSETRRFAAVLGELINGRASLFMNSLTIRNSATTIVARYAFRRRQFGMDVEQPIISYPAVQLTLIPILGSCYAFEFAKRKFLNLFEKNFTEDLSDNDLAQIHAMSAGLKAITTWDTQTYIQKLRNLTGGHGYSAYNRLGTMREDHDVFQTFEGDNAVLTQQLGAYLMKKFKKSLSGGTTMTILQFVAKEFGYMWNETNPYNTRKTSFSHLTSFDFLYHAFTYRTARLMVSAASYLNKHKSKKGFFNAWNATVPRMTQLARAYIEQYALKCFAKGIQQIKDKKLKKLLKYLCAVWALSIIQRDMIHFVDLISTKKAKAIQRTIEKLCKTLSLHAVGLVDAFEIPDFLIDSPIGISKGNYVENIIAYTGLTKNKVNKQATDFLLSKFKAMDTTRRGTEKSIYDQVHDIDKLDEMEDDEIEEDEVDVDSKVLPTKIENIKTLVTYDKK